MTPTGPDPLRAEDLLRETPWLRRIARAMTIDDAAADDLVQDVVSDVLAAPPRVERTSLRAWLRTVVRRRAGRTRRRQDVAQRAERGAARPEAKVPSIDEDERLELHEELARVVRSLSKDDRHLIVRRYFDGVAPRVLADELGVSPATARQRLSRALSRLRERLAKTERGAERWSLALVALAELPAPPPPPPVPDAPSPLAPTWRLALMSTPQIFVAVGAAGAALVAVIALRSTPDVGTVTDVVIDAPDREVATALVAPEPESSEREVQLAPSTSSAPAVAVTSENAAPTIRVIGPDGPVTDARAAWVDEVRTARSIDLAADGTAPRPEADAFRLFVAAPGYIAHHETIADEGDVLVELESAPVVRGVVTIDGGEPGRRLRLGFMGLGDTIDPGVKEWESGLSDRLTELGVIADQHEILTDERGRFRLELATSHARLLVWLPDGYVAGDAQGIQLDRDRSSTRIDVGPDEVALDLISVPMVTGRYVWDDDGSPVQGLAMILRNDDEGYGIDGSRHVRIGPDGRFTVGVDERLDEPRVLETDAPEEPIAQRLLGERAHAVRVYVSDPSYIPGSDRSFEIRGDSFPIDVGEIRIPRPAEASVRVLAHVDDDWHPVRAVIRAPGHTSTTDDDGHASVLASPGDPLDVLAAGYEFVRVRVPEDTTAEPFEIRLERAPTLTIRYPVSWTDVPYELQPVVRIDYDESPYGSWSESAVESPEYHIRHHSRLYGVWRSGLSMVQSNWTEFALERDGEVEIHGLGRGATFTVAVYDCFRRPIVSEVVTFDGARTIDLGARQPAVARLTCTIAAPDGSAITKGRIGLHGDGWGSFRGFDGDSVVLGPLAPLPCTVSFESRGHGRTEKQEVGLHPGENAHAVVLEVDGD